MLKQTCWLFFFFVLNAPTTFAADVKTVDQVDLNKYIGRWYEIASLPQFFQKDCVRSTMAEYKLLENGYVEVLNSCETKSGTIKKAEGRARPVDEKRKAKLEVTFVKLFAWIFTFGGDYWIIDLASDYSYAVVGHPDRTYGWILSRQTSLPVATLNEIKARLKEQGYDICQFLTTPQEGGFKEKQKLCDI